MQHNLIIRGGQEYPSALFRLTYCRFSKGGYYLAVQFEEDNKTLGSKLLDGLRNKHNTSVEIEVSWEKDWKLPHPEMRINNQTFLWFIDSIRTIGYEVTENPPFC